MAPLQFAPQQLRQARRAAGLTAQELAILIDASVFTVYAWETGRSVPPCPQLSAIADALGCRLVDFFSEQPSTEGTSEFGRSQAARAVPASGPMGREPDGGNREYRSYAEAEINYRDIRGRLRVPANHARHLIDAVIAGLCIAAMVGGPVGVLAYGGASLPSGTLLALCVIYLVAFGVLTGMVVIRR